MKENRRRHIASRILLAVFLPMLLLTSLHVHQSQAASEVACVDCDHHQPHAGHLTAAQASFHDCVLCQISHVPFLLAAALVLTINIHLLCASRRMGQQRLVLRVEGVQSSRAPPFYLN